MEVGEGGVWTVHLLENAISMKEELHRFVFGLALNWEQCLNSQVGGGGMREKDLGIDDTPYIVAVCYRLHGIEPFVMKVEKRLTNEGDWGCTLAFLLKGPAGTRSVILFAGQSGTTFLGSPVHRWP